MCLILFAHDAHPRYHLVVAANRDEFHARPSAPAAPWEDAPSVIAGRDLRGGGTWMGVTRAGRWAAVTNFRDRREQRPDAPSRGGLVSDFLRGNDLPAHYTERVSARAVEYNGFNLLVGEPGSLIWLSNRAPECSPRPLAAGVYGLSNHLLDTPWPKIERGKRALESLLKEPKLGAESLLEILLDHALTADREFPETSRGPGLERVLSTIFVADPEYGTRSSTALLVDRDGRALFVERSYLPQRTDWQERRYEFQVEPTA